MTAPDSVTAAAITRAAADDLEDVARLFDAYRVFYAQAADPATARSFIAERLRRGDSAILLARESATGAALGFVQLYPSFSSVSARRIWILNDLFVAPSARKRGVGRALMDAAQTLARDEGALRVVLETADDNAPAQALYESLGYVRERDTRHYSLALPA